MQFIVQVVAMKLEVRLMSNASILTVLLMIASMPIISCCGKQCPEWTSYNLTADQCVCRDRLNPLLLCNQDSKKLSLPRCYCLTYNELTNLTVVGPCMLMCDNRKIHPCSLYNQLKGSDALEVSEWTCKPYKRTGQLCSKCLTGYGLPVYSYSETCVKCPKSSFKRNLAKYFAVAYVPLTLLYLAVIIFKISINSGRFVAYILSAQLLATPAVIRLLLAQKSNQQAIFYFLISCFSIWNLDFFRSFYTPFCIHPDLNKLHVLVLDYFVAAYPLFLILLTYIAVFLHDRYSVVVKICKPLHKVCAYIHKKWDVRGSLIQAFSTFLVLSYIKMLNVSFDLLFPLRLSDIEGNTIQQMYLYNEAEIKYFGREHLPYGVLAIAMLTIFNLLPMILLFLYPCRCFQRCLNRCGVRSQLLHTFMDAFQGCYRHKPRDCRYFAGTLFCIRILLLVVFTVSNDNTFTYTASGCFFVFLVVVIHFIEPYNSTIHNKTSMPLFLLPAVICFLSGAKGHQVPAWYLIHYLMAASAGLLALYGALLLTHRIVPQRLISSVQSCRRLILHYFKRRKEREVSANECLPHRLEQETSPLMKY